MSLIQKVSNNRAKRLASKISIEQLGEIMEKVIEIFPRLSDKFDIKRINTTEDLIGLWSYGYQFGIGALVKGFLLITIALILGIFTSSVIGMLVSIIIISVTFSSLRVLAGGYHMKTFGSCMLISLAMFLGSALVAQNTYQNWSNINLWGLLSFCVTVGLYIIYRYVPRDTPNKLITKETEIRKFKRWSLTYLISWFIIIGVCLLFSFKLIVISSCFGLLLELFTISNLGYNHFYSKLELINFK